jgi:hypothetical protein
MKLLAGDHLLGFLNIEFHNNKFFETEEALTDYIETNLIAFRYLLEYQFLKKTFFQAITTSIQPESMIA